MKMGAIPAAGRFSNARILLPLLALLLLAGCRTCPIDVCHIRKVHYHNGVKYRARPIWKMQYPAVGERIRVNHEGSGKRPDNDRSKPLK